MTDDSIYKDQCEFQWQYDALLHLLVKYNNGPHTDQENQENNLKQELHICMRQVL